jgi:hypothetical protein
MRQNRPHKVNHSTLFRDTLDEDESSGHGDNHDSSAANIRIGFRIVVAGAKGGKSTCVRYLVNHS